MELITVKKNHPPIMREGSGYSMLLPTITWSIVDLLWSYFDYSTYI